MNQVVNGCGSCVSQALHYMLLVSEVEETEIFKICLEYWNHLAAELYRESPFSTSTSPLLSGNQHFDVPPRRQLYLPVLSKVAGGSSVMGVCVCVGVGRVCECEGRCVCVGAGAYAWDIRWSTISNNDTCKDCKIKGGIEK